jgi:predicted esterase YcpF (UPF0227 family)
MKTLVYFHGYGSNNNTYKVDMLRQMFPKYQVLAFNSDIDPDVAKTQVSQKIMESIVDDQSDDEMIFVGTSLGAWLANELSDQFKCKAVLINPTYNPKLTLAKYGVAEEVLVKYTKMNLSDLDRKSFFIDPNDEIIDQTELMGLVKFESISGGHQCGGDCFKSIMSSLKL